MDKLIESKLSTYPSFAKQALLQLRERIFYIAKSESLGPITENLKWEQLSYSGPKGSPIRIDWKSKSPHSISIFCHCQTKLISTFKEVYPDTFIYSGNREMVLTLNQISVSPELAYCLSVALRYHELKEKPLLGF